MKHNFKADSSHRRPGVNIAIWICNRKNIPREFVKQGPTFLIHTIWWQKLQNFKLYVKKEILW